MREEVRRFVETARRVGYADPYEVDDYLRQGTKAFLAGKYATSRGVFEALFAAISYGDVDLGQDELVDDLREVASLWEPLEQLERVATGPLPELDAFLPRWVEHLERQPQSENEWDDNRDRCLRAAVLRLEGVLGLERIALKTRKPEALRAWCEALAGRGEWAEALRVDR